MSRSTRRSPSPSATPQGPIGPMSRRQLLAGAGTAVGAGLLLGGTGFSLASAAGLRTPAQGGRLLASTPASAASGTVTFGSNYSDDVPKAAFQAMIDGLGNPDID